MDDLVEVKLMVNLAKEAVGLQGASLEVWRLLEEYVEDYVEDCHMYSHHIDKWTTMTAMQKSTV